MSSASITVTTIGTLSTVASERVAVTVTCSPSPESSSATAGAVIAPKTKANAVVPQTAFKPPRIVPRSFADGDLGPGTPSNHSGHVIIANASQNQSHLMCGIAAWPYASA